MNTSQLNKNCQSLMNKLYQSKHWENVKTILLRWKDQPKELSSAINQFKHIFSIMDTCEGTEEKIFQAFCRCLSKDIQVTKKIVMQYVDNDNPVDNYIPNLQTENDQPLLPEPIKKQSRPSLSHDKTIQVAPLSQLQQIKDAFLQEKLEQHIHGQEIIKIINIYLKCIITLQQFKALLHPLYQKDQSLIHYLFQVAEDVSKKRRKVTIFAPLNQLIDQKYPVMPIGPSYIIIPEGYANYGCDWKINPQQSILNRKCVSVPLGSEVSFIIGKKNQFQEQLFNYEDQRYEIDMALQSLRACQKMIKRYCTEQNIVEGSHVQSKLASALVQRVVNDLYPGQSVYNIFIRHLGLAKEILLPRVTSKRQELQKLRQKFVKVCEEVSSKNFKKSLDYRCIYFAKNDRKYNTPSRWDKEIEMRKKQLSEELKKPIQEDIEDRESLTRHREEYVNTFDHITNQNFMANQSVTLNFDRKYNAIYPAFPDNQILFILNFKDQEVLNDVLEIILYNCNRKNLLELLVFKTMKMDIKKKIKKSPLLLSILQNKQKIQNNSEVAEILALNPNNPKNMFTFKKDSNNSEQLNSNNNQLEETFLNEVKSSYSKNFKDSEDEFMQMIEQQEQPACLEDIQSPFEGPKQGYTFIGTKPIYIFMRYLLTIYQRFVKAKEQSEQRSSVVVGNGEENEDSLNIQQEKIDLYKFFITILIYKIRDKNKNNFEEHLRKLYCEKAFIFFTLEKLIVSAAKVINTISTDSLTYQILKDQTKDYELGIFDWEKFPFPTVTNQLSRLYKEKQMLYRFTFCKSEGNFYISAWNPSFKEYYEQQKCSELQQIIQYSKKYLLSSAKLQKKQQNENSTQNDKILKQQNSQFIIEEINGALIMKGEEYLIRKDRRRCDEGQNLYNSLRKMKKMQDWI